MNLQKLESHRAPKLSVYRNRIVLSKDLLEMMDINPDEDRIEIQKDDNGTVYLKKSNMGYAIKTVTTPSGPSYKINFHGLVDVLDNTLSLGVSGLRCALKRAVEYNDTLYYPVYVLSVLTGKKKVTNELEIEINN